MLFLVNSRLPESMTREEFIELATTTPPSSAWDLIRTGTLRQFAYKTGEEPGVVGFIEAESIEEVEAHLATLPIAAMIDFEIDPLNPLARF